MQKACYYCCCCCVSLFSFTLGHRFITNVYCSMFSCFGTPFVLRRPPPQEMMQALWTDFQLGKRPVISFKYSGFTENLTPLYPICVQVCVLFLLRMHCDAICY